MIGDYHYLSIDGMCNHLTLSMVERVVHPATCSNSYKLLLYPSTHLTEEPIFFPTMDGDIKKNMSNQ